MKTLGKLGLLFGLIFAGRYMQSIEPVAAGMQRKPPIVLLSPPTSTAHYVALVDTASYFRSRPAPASSATDVIWY